MFIDKWKTEYCTLFNFQFENCEFDEKFYNNIVNGLDQIRHTWHTLDRLNHDISESDVKHVIYKAWIKQP